MRAQRRRAKSGQREHPDERDQRVARKLQRMNQIGHCHQAHDGAAIQMAKKPAASGAVRQCRQIPKPATATKLQKRMRPPAAFNSTR